VRRNIQPPRAAASLLLAEVPGSTGADGRMTSQASAPIHPISIIRTAGGLHFHMAANGCVGVQRERASFLWRFGRPAFALVDTPVLAHNPVLGLVRMAGERPTAQLRIERVV